MPSKLLMLGRWAGVTVVLVVLVAAVATWLKHREEIDGVPDQQKIARTLEIIRTSTPADHKVLKVLFYGQSITRGGWHHAVAAHWREKYPNTVFVVENRAGASGNIATEAALRAPADGYSLLLAM